MWPLATDRPSNSNYAMYDEIEILLAMKLGCNLVLLTMRFSYACVTTYFAPGSHEYAKIIVRYAISLFMQSHGVNEVTFHEILLSNRMT